MGDGLERGCVSLSSAGEYSHLLLTNPDTVELDDFVRRLATEPSTSAYLLNSTSTPSPPIAVDRVTHPSGIVPALQNVVATCYLGCELKLKRIAEHARNAEYNPKRFAAVIMRIREPKTTALIFSSGKMVVTGARNEQDSRLASRKFAKIVMKLGYQVTFRDFKIQNIVGSCDVQFQIGLERLNAKHNLFSRYEPELFPGLIYKMKVPKVVLLIFLSGKVVLTGAKTRQQIYRAFENIYPALMEFRKNKRKLESLETLSIATSVQKAPQALGTPSHSINDARSPRAEEGREKKIALSPFLSSKSLSQQQSLREQSASMAASANIDLYSAALSDSFYSKQHYTAQVSASGENSTLQGQMTNPAVLYSSTYFIPRQSPQY